MSEPSESWEQRLTEAWSSLGHEPDAAFLERLQALVKELPAGDAIGLFELASAQDSTGNTGNAVPLYERALGVGLSGLRRRRAVIQLASSLRTLGRAAESVALLSSEADAPQDELSGAVSAFLALSLVEVGREREAVSLSLLALAPHLPRYNASLLRYAAALMESEA